jgi:DNA topoisomerase-2
LPGLIALNHTAQGYSEFHTNLTVCFVVRLTPESAEWTNHEIEKKFKLAKYVSLSNMHLYDENGRIERYDGSLDVLRQFYKIRRGWYIKRRVRSLPSHSLRST